jgi:hypothetical protein
MPRIPDMRHEVDVYRGQVDAFAVEKNRADAYRDMASQPIDPAKVNEQLET